MLATAGLGDAHVLLKLLTWGSRPCFLSWLVGLAETWLVMREEGLPPSPSCSSHPAQDQTPAVKGEDRRLSHLYLRHPWGTPGPAGEGQGLYL